MRTLRVTVAALTTLLVVGLAGCAGSDPGLAPDTSDAGGGTPTGSPTTAPGDDAVATQVEYARSGGITGGHTTYTFTAGEPPPAGFSAEQQQEILDLASMPALRELPVRAARTRLCCDRSVYQVTVTWGDGTSHTFTTADGLATPTPLDRLLRALG